MLIEGIESRCKGVEEQRKTPRHPPSLNLPTREELLATKANKRVSLLDIKPQFPTLFVALQH